MTTTPKPGKSAEAAELARELARLDKGATAGPWCWDNRGQKCNDIQVGTACTEPDGSPIAGYFDEENVTYLDGVAEVTSIADANLITGLRNSLPTILDCLNELSELRAQQEKAVEEEREECARVADENEYPWRNTEPARRIASAIRARSRSATAAETRDTEQTSENRPKWA